ncbi:MAG TPA: hypothetical protein VJ853_01555 [Thermoanaerobaculia bacterium]|nr:hypothetical protein [Thermoanaerobaculia bacterium]
MRRAQIVLVVLVACARPQTPREMVRPAMQWTTVLQFTGERWMAEAVPASIVRSIVADADKTIDKTAVRVMDSNVPRDERAEIGRALEIARDAAADLRDAAERGDRAAAASAITRFAAAHARLQQVR